MPNRLSKETSPYLLQHQNNPVDWYPWGEEALDLSVELNKPILLSIGYSACHWCHVMEHESFENPEIANLMNRNFICIKVDREERPDLDQIYQNVAQALTHGGGWPLTVFLTPARRPFFGGTYFPPEDRYGRAGLKRVLVSLTKAYLTDPMGVAQNAMKLTAFIEAAESTASQLEGGSKKPDVALMEKAAESLLNNVDFQNGGIGDAPKFPNVMAFNFLWRLGSLRKSDAAKEAVLLTLRKMASGGIYDQLGGGFSRYSVDATWSVPHFEKMLYDNGLLLKLYSEVLLTRDPLITAEDRKLFVGVIRESVTYLLREMVSPDGGFFAAQDADSEGEEGKFFAWDERDLLEVLPDAQEREIFSLRFGVSEGGNFEHGKTVLFIARSFEEISKRLGIPTDQVALVVEKSKRKAFEARSKRIPPATDIKVLASWNGLMISGLCWAAQLLREEGHTIEADQALSAASCAFKLVVENMGSGQDGKLASTFQGGEPKLNAYLDDYAFMAAAALDLARVSSEESVISKAIQMSVLWTKRIIRHFKDKKAPGYFFTSDDHEELVHRPKSIFDQAIPSGVSVTLECLSVLSEIDETVMEEFSAELQKQLFGLISAAEKNPFGCSELLAAGLLYLVGPVVVSGPGSEAACKSPFVFRKLENLAQRSKLLVCHRKSCDAPYSGVAEMVAGALAKAGKL
jgi:uncharacterized protein YyaL (SSP411 family)